MLFLFGRVYFIQMAKQEHEPHISKTQENFLDNPLFLIQVERRDGRGGRGPVRELPGSPFPPEPSDQELTKWMNKMDQNFKSI